MEKEFLDMVMEYFNKICDKHPDIEKIPNEFEKSLEETIKEIQLLKPRCKTKASFPYALILKLMPYLEIAEKFKNITVSEYKKQKGKNIKQTKRDESDIEKLRFENDNAPPFEYFTNIVMNKGKTRAAWFEFDNMDL